MLPSPHGVLRPVILFSSYSLPWNGRNSHHELHSSGRLGVALPGLAFGFLDAVCPHFNPALGNLTSVQYADQWDAFSGTTITLRNNGTVAASVAGVPLTFNESVGPFPDGGAVNTPSPASPFFVSGTLSAGVTQAFNPTPTAGMTTPYFASSNLAAWIGSGTFNIPTVVFATTRPSNLPSDVAFVDFTITPTHSSVFGSRLVYTYDAVPEPATWSAGIAALVWLVQQRRR